MSRPDHPHPNANLAALIGSRICHDLISPVGAITNGLELLSLAGAPGQPELALVRGSADGASARLRFFRLAFGQSGVGQMMSRAEIAGILGAVYTGRVSVTWQIAEDVSRPVAQAALLAVMCAEDLMPFGGTITVRGMPDAVGVAGTAERPAEPGAHWTLLGGGTAPLSPAQAQFALLPAVLADLGRHVTVDHSPGTVSLGF